MPEAGFGGIGGGVFDAETGEASGDRLMSRFSLVAGVAGQVPLN